MANPTLGPADVTINATVSVPLSGDDLVIRDDTQKARYFAADQATIVYTQSYTDAGSADETASAWEVTAVVSGLLITGGSVGKRRASRTFREDVDADEPVFPTWLAGVIDKYHPGKAV